MFRIQRYIKKLSFFQVYTMAENKSDKERIDGGELLLRVILEIAGSPKEHVEKAITLLVDKLEDKDYVSELVSEEVLEATEHEKHEKIFTSIAELEFWIRSPGNLVDLAFDFMPASIELVEPENPNIKNKALTSMLNELMAKLHRSDMIVKNVSAQKQILERNSNVLLRNFLIYLMKHGEKSLAELSERTGIPAEQLTNFLAVLEKGGDIKNDKGVFSRVRRPKNVVQNNTVNSPSKPAAKSTKKDKKDKKDSKDSKDKKSRRS